MNEAIHDNETQRQKLIKARTAAKVEQVCPATGGTPSFTRPKAASKDLYSVEEMEQHLAGLKKEEVKLTANVRSSSPLGSISGGGSHLSGAGRN